MTDPGGGVPSPPPRATVIGIAAAAALVPLNSTMIAVALPEIADRFDVSAGRVSVLVTVYLVAMLAGQPIGGRVGDRVGSRPTALASLGGLAVCSVAAAAAPTFAALVVARGLQAACAAGIGPAVQAMLRAASPPADRGRTFGILGSVIAVGAAVGPIVGGGVIELFGWRAIFLVNVPVVAGAVVALTGATVAGGGTAPVVTDPAVRGGGRIANPVFVASFAAQALSTQGQYALLLLAPMILAARGWSAGTTGLALAALTVGMIVTGPPGGRAGDRHGRRAPVLAGLAVAAVAIGVTAAGGAGISPGVLVVALAVFGVGTGFAVPSMMTAALESVRQERTGSAAGILSTSRYVGSITTSVAISLLVTDGAAGAGTVLAAGTVAALAACAAALRLPARRAPEGSGEGAVGAVPGAVGD